MSLSFEFITDILSSC